MYIKEVAKILGVDIGDVFTINRGILKYRFTPTSIEVKKTREEWITSNKILVPLITGEVRIIESKYIPEKGDKYYTYTGYFWDITEKTWIGNASDYIHLKSGIIFRTKEKAESFREISYIRITIPIKEHPYSYYTFDSTSLLASKWFVCERKWEGSVRDYINAYENLIYEDYEKARTSLSIRKLVLEHENI